MKTFIVTAAGFASLLLLATTCYASSVSDAQDKVDQAQSDFDGAKASALSIMSSSDKTRWKQAEAKYESLVAAGKDSGEVASRKQAVMDIEKHVLAPPECESLDRARDELTAARAKLALAKAKASPPHQSIGNDDSSQAIQPENRTQNGANFTIRSERDSESHPPLPSSQ